MDETMKQFIIECINELEIEGPIKQSTYNALILALLREFNIPSRVARATLIATLREFYSESEAKA